MRGSLISGLWVIARTTYAETARRPVYYITLAIFSILIFFSQFITLFSFYQEINMIREMGAASLALWALIVLVVVSGTSVTTELEDRTALLVLSKPLSRSGFLLGKYFGILLALVAGIFFLSEILFLTLWLAEGMDLLSTAYFHKDAFAGVSVPGFIWKSFMAHNGLMVFQACFLTCLNLAVLAAVCVSLSAFLPQVVTVAATVLIFILGNISSYMAGSVEGTWLSLPARGFTYLMPNLGYFNLQSFFSEARIISLNYLFAATVYAALYVGTILFVSGSLFERREIR